MHTIPRRLLRSLALALLASLVCVTLVAAYAEEPLHFRDPRTGQVTDDEVSSIHDDLTYALALAAGLTVEDATTLQLYDQLVDSESLGPGGVISYTNCLGSFNPAPTPAEAGCTAGGDYSQVAWPLWDKVSGPLCVTSRYGPYMPFFHFPHQNAAGLGALHDWGWGLTDELRGYEAYAWGGPTLLSATCTYTRPATIDTGLEAGELPAFATYLHSLADYYSHRECIAAMDGLGMPWATHTIKAMYDLPPCNYNPAAPNNFDAHGREFGTASMADSQRTDEAILAVYDELCKRSLQREGHYYPLDLDAPLTGMDGAPTLRQALYDFVHNWAFSQASERRAYVDQLVPALLAQRVENRRMWLPRVLGK